MNNPPCRAGDMGLILGQGTKIPYAVDQLSPHTTFREPTCHNETVRVLQQMVLHDAVKIPHATTMQPIKLINLRSIISGTS